MPEFIYQACIIVIALLTTKGIFWAGQICLGSVQQILEEHKEKGRKPLLLLAKARDEIEQSREMPCKGCRLPGCTWCELDEFLEKNDPDKKTK